MPVVIVPPWKSVLWDKENHLLVLRDFLYLTLTFTLGQSFCFFLLIVQIFMRLDCAWYGAVYSWQRFRLKWEVADCLSVMYIICWLCSLEAILACRYLHEDEKLSVVLFWDQKKKKKKVSMVVPREQNTVTEDIRTSIYLWTNVMSLNFFVWLLLKCALFSVYRNMYA